VREGLKAAARAIALVAVAPAIASYYVRSAWIGRDAALEASTQALGLIPGLTGQYLRRAFLSRVLAGCHAQAVIGFGTVLSKSGATIGENAYIGPHCHLGLVHVGRNALIASGVHIPSGRHTHGLDDPDRDPRDQPGRHEAVRIGEGAWIGANAVVLADVGRGTVVGAGSVVSRPLPDGVIAAGVPAVVIRERGRS
jgi:acetyltransferase-like isoleucine patch superfamily enzyme